MAMSDPVIFALVGAALLLIFLGYSIGNVRQPAATSMPASTNDRLTAVENRLLETEQKLNKISVEIQHLPSAETVHSMAVKIAEIGGDVKALQSSVLATNRLVERIDQWLLAKEKA